MQGVKGLILRKGINNFLVTAYNNVVEEITITQNGFNGFYMSYLYGKVRERFSFLPAVCDMQKEGDCTRIAFKTERAYCPYVRRFTEENIADVIAVGYKYGYLNERITLPLLDKRQKRLLITSLVAADLQEDRAFVARRISGFERYCLDGVYHFRLRELKERWEEIAQYVPTDMGTASLENFLRFVAEDGDGKVFLKEGKVYDESYRLLSRSSLTGEVSPVGEILLGGAERVYCFGETDQETAAFLKKYYREKAVFY